MDKSSLTLGWLVGRQIAGQRRTQEKQPIAYLYNGVQLPPLPEWDKERYPYAWMTITGEVLYVVDKPHMRCTGDNGKDYFYINGNSESGEFVNYAVYKLSADGTNFVYSSKGDNVDGRWLGMSYPPLWTNYDVIDVDDGSVYLSASEPIPIYE